MSVRGQPRRLSDLGMSASPPTPDYRCDAAKRRFGPATDLCAAAKKSSHYSITELAATSRAGGTVSPSAFEVLRLMIIKNLTGI